MKSKQSFTFKYTNALCKAIEDFTHNAEVLDSAAFRYRGANLKFAVERALYIYFINNRNLYNLFIRYAEGEEFSEVVEFANEIEKGLALCLCGSRINSRQLAVRKKHFFNAGVLAASVRKLIPRIYLFLIQLVRYLLFRPKNSPAVFIYTIHEKFVRFFQPIAEHLSVSYAYLTTMTPLLEPYLVKSKIPFLSYYNFLRFFKKPKLSSALAQFRGIVLYYDQLYTSLEFFMPKCVVLMEGNAMQDEVVNQVCKQLSIPTVCVQQGWSPVIHSGFRNMSFTKMLVWGDGFSELLKQYNPRQHFTAVGNHMVVFPNGTNDPSGNKKGKGVCFFLQSPNNLITQEEWNEFIRLIKWTAASFTDTPVLVREHPSYPLSQKCRAELRYFPNIRLMDPWSYSMSEVLGMSRVSVSIYSSALLESIAAGVVPVAYNVVSLPSYFSDKSFLRAGVEVRSFVDAQGAMRNLLKDDLFIRECEPRMEEFRKKYFHFDRENAIGRIIDEITPLLN